MTGEEEEAEVRGESDSEVAQTPAFAGPAVTTQLPSKLNPASLTNAACPCSRRKLRPLATSQRRASWSRLAVRSFEPSG